MVVIDKASHSLGLLSLAADLSVEDEVESAYARARDQFGHLDVIDNNAGLMDRENRSALAVGAEV